VQHGLDVGAAETPVAEDVQTDHRFRGVALLPVDEADESVDTEEYGDDDAPVLPRGQNTTAGEGHQDRSRRDQEEHSAEPIDSEELVKHMSRYRLLLEEELEHDASEYDEGKKDPENPSPGRILGKDTAGERPDETANCPHGSQPPEPFATLVQRYKIGDDDFSKDDNAAGTNALDCTAN